jgi:hypothetical protein
MPGNVLVTPGIRRLCPVSGIKAYGFESVDPTKGGCPALKHDDDESIPD